MLNDDSTSSHLIGQPGSKSVAAELALKHYINHGISARYADLDTELPLPSKSSTLFSTLVWSTVIGAYCRRVSVDEVTLDDLDAMLTGNKPQTKGGRCVNRCMRLYANMIARNTYVKVAHA